MINTIRIGSFMRWRGYSIVAAALLSTLTGLSLSNAAPARADTLPPDCGARFVMLSVRGTIEGRGTDQYGDSHINSTYISEVSDALVNTGNVKKEDITAHDVDYPAVAYDPSTGTDYSDSVATGVGNLTDDIRQYSACGPDHPVLILIGYSQGAQVVKQTLNNIASSTRPSGNVDDENIGAAINIADPTRSNDPPVGQMLTVNPDWSQAPQPDSLHGGVINQIPVADQFASRFFDICRTDDLACNAPAAPLVQIDPQEPPTPLEQFYAESKSPATFPHLRYADPAALGDATTIAAQAASAAEAQYANLNPAPPATEPSPPPPSSTAPAPSSPAPSSPAPDPSAPIPPVPSSPAPIPPPPPSSPAPTSPPAPGSVPPRQPDQGVPGPTVYQEDAWGREMNIRQFATTDSRVIYVLKGPATIDVQCQVHGQRVIYGPYDNDGWSYLPAYGGWISDIFISRNQMVPRVPDCGSTVAPKVRADVPHALMPKSVIPAPEVLKPFQAPTTPPPAPTTPSRAAQPPHERAPEPAAPSQPTVRIGNLGLL